jgi:hypothetical protein
MFTAVQAHTSTVFGNSAIDDVTKAAPELKVCYVAFLLVCEVLCVGDFC